MQFRQEPGNRTCCFVSTFFILKGEVSDEKVRSSLLLPLPVVVSFGAYKSSAHENDDTKNRSIKFWNSIERESCCVPIYICVLNDSVLAKNQRSACTSAWWWSEESKAAGASIIVFWSMCCVTFCPLYYPRSVRDRQCNVAVRWSKIIWICVVAKLCRKKQEQTR